LTYLTPIDMLPENRSERKMEMFRKSMVLFPITILASYIIACRHISGIYMGVPTPEMCWECHALDKVYNEWKGSMHAMKNVACHDCHIPCTEQGVDNLRPDEGKSFSIFGFLNPETSRWERLTRNEMCSRCHKLSKTMVEEGGSCIDCHMPVQGQTSYTVLKEKKVIRSVTLAHMSHTFRSYSPPHF